MKAKERLIELLKAASEEAGKHFREATKKVLAEKGRFNSAEDIDRRSIYEIEADYLLENGVIVPPCKVGDVVYVVREETLKKEKVLGIKIGNCGIFVQVSKGEDFEYFPEHKIFFKKEEAEVALNKKG